MPLLIAKETSGDDVPLTILASILARRPVFSRALKSGGAAFAKFVPIHEVAGTSWPHFITAIEATAILAFESLGTVF